MVLKRMPGMRRNYRFQRSTSDSGERIAAATTITPSSSALPPASSTPPLRSGDAILSTDGMRVGWMLDGGGGGGGRRAQSSYGSSQYSHSLPCSPCIHASYPHYWTIGRVKFGIPLEQVCKNDDIPGPLLVLILKLNKEGSTKKDVFRAPGHQGSMKKLVHFLHSGRLVNIDNFSVYTIASVLKKFLRKLPEGIFGGRAGEEELFRMIQLTDTEQQRDLAHRLIASRPVVTQHLLVLLFGTFRVIANNAERSNTGMTSEALGVSVAPSFFHSCVGRGKTASMDDVLRFKVATQIMKFMIDNFGVSNLFGRENYEYYARITGRILKVEEDWIFAFRYPPESLVTRQFSLEVEQSWLQFEADRWGLKFNLEAMAGQEESQSTPALIHIPECTGDASGGDLGSSGGGEGCSGLQGAAGMMGAGSGSSLRMTVPENNLRESCTRLSISLEENGLYKAGGGGCSGSGSGESRSGGGGGALTSNGGGAGLGSAGGNSATKDLTLEELRQVNHYAESTKSLSFLPQVHERQTERMRTRSEWFLTPQQCAVGRGGIILLGGEGVGTYYPATSPVESEGSATLTYHAHALAYARHHDTITMAAARKHGSDESKLLRRSSSKDKERRLVRRSSSKKDKENGQKKRDSLRVRSASAEVKGHSLQQQSSSPSMLQNITHSILQPAPQPLQLLQQQPNVMYSSQQPQQLLRPLHHQHSHDLLLASPGRRGLVGDGDDVETDVGGRGKMVGVTTQEAATTLHQQQQQQSHQRQIPLTELDCTQTDIQRVHVSNIYKPRI